MMFYTPVDTAVRGAITKTYLVGGGRLGARLQDLHFVRMFTGAVARVVRTVLGAFPIPVRRCCGGAGEVVRTVAISGSI